MIYEQTTTTTTTPTKTSSINHDDENSNNHCIISWDSPLSPSSLYTKMEVEVIGIYTGSSSSSSSPQNPTPTSSASGNVPNMAMVVVKKKPPTARSSSLSPSSHSMPPMMKNLFDDSERKILQELDRGLDDFVAGKIKIDNDSLIDNSNNVNARFSSIPTKTAEEAIEAELMATVDDDDDRVLDRSHANRKKGGKQQGKSNDVILDAQVSSKMLSPKSSTGVKKGYNDNFDVKTIVDVAAARERALATMKVPADKSSKPETPSSSKATSSSKKSAGEKVTQDFAVEAAKRVAEAKRYMQPTDALKQSAIRDNNVEDEDFAVSAPRKVAQAKAAKAPSATTTTKMTRDIVDKKSFIAKDALTNEPRQQQGANKVTEGKPLDVSDGFRAYESMSRYRSIYQSISHPHDWLKRQTNTTNQGIKKSLAVNSLAMSSSSSPPPLPTESLQKKIRKTQQRKNEKTTPIDTDDKSSSNSNSTPHSNEKPPIESNATVATTMNDTSNKPQRQVERKRKLNVNIIDDDVDIDTALNPLKSGAKLSYDTLNAVSMERLPPKTRKEVEAMKETTRVMEELASKGPEMSPEDLLRDILKFDEDAKREEIPGSGFVSGAFDKAKQLLQERNQKRERTSQKPSGPQVGVKEMHRSDLPRPQVPISSTESMLSSKKVELTPEEELKAMFAAGQRIANGRITQKFDDADEIERAIEKEVDDLIRSDKSVSSYARILDDELAELEVSINISPGEELDGPAANPIFDPMSGPDVYNRNVDLDSVNYPGAIPGTKEVRLPKELREAVKQAEFAVGVLMNLETIEEENGETKHFAGKQELSAQQVESLQQVVAEACEIGIIDNPVILLQESSRLQMVLDEMWNQPEERFREIASNYKDLLLSDYFVKLIRQRMNKMAERDLDALRNDDDSLRETHAREREILGYLVMYAQVLLKEARALGAQLEAQQLEIIRSICNVAMNPKHTTEQETAMALSDAVRDMRPLLDDMFVAYLKYAVAEEEARLARSGLLDDPEHSQWLFVLKIVQQGVYAEIAKGINRYIDHIWYILRMDTPRQRRLMLDALVDAMPTMDVRPFVQVVDNIVGSLGDSVKGEFDDVAPLGEMTNKLLQLHRDMKEVLPPDRIAEKSRDADEWAARQKKRMLEQRRIGEQRLRAAKDTQHLEDEIDALIGGGEVERFD